MAATVSARRQALAEFARSRRGEAPTGWLIRQLAMGVVILGLVSLVVMWLLGFLSTPKEVLAVRAAVDTQVAELERMASGEVPYGEAAGSFGTVMESMRQVPDPYREQARREMGLLFEAREVAEVNSFFAVLPAARAAEMDRRIKAEEERRARWQADRERRAAERGGDAARPTGQAGGGTASQVASQPAGGQRRRGDGTEESRNARSKSRLDKTTAASRARGTEYRRLKDQRRIELGLPPRW